MAYIFSQRQGTILIPRWYGVHWTFLKLLYWNWWSSILEKVVSGNLSRFLKGVKPLVCMMWIAGWLLRQCKGNWPHLNLILGTPSNFHSCGDFSVLLVLWQCCWGLSGVQLSKSRFLTCLIGKTQLLWTQCWEIGPHLAARRKSHGFFSSCGRNLGYILELRRGCPFETGVCSGKSGHLSKYEGQPRNVN